MVHCKLDKHHKQVFSCDYGLSHWFGESFLSLVLLPAMLVPVTTDQSCAQCTKHGTVGKDVILWRWWWCWQWVGCCSVLCFTLGYQVDCAVALRVSYAIVADLATLLCAAFDRERAGDGTFINDTVNHTNLEGADDVYNLSRIPYLTEDLPQAPPPHRVKGLCQVHKHHVKIPVLLPALLLHQLSKGNSCLVYEALLSVMCRVRRLAITWAWIFPDSNEMPLWLSQQSWFPLCFYRCTIMVSLYSWATPSHCSRWQWTYSCVRGVARMLQPHL